MRSSRHYAAYIAGACVLHAAIGIALARAAHVVATPTLRVRESAYAE